MVSFYLLRPFSSFLFLSVLFISPSVGVSPPITGHSFDFTISYTPVYNFPGPRDFSTTTPPSNTTIFPPENLSLRVPRITLTGNPSDALKSSKYIAFLATSRVPLLSALDDEIYSFSWYHTNMTVLPNNTLAATRSDKGLELDGYDETNYIYYTKTYEYGEVRNVSLHVWRQTPELDAFLTAKQTNSTLKMPVWFDLMGVWRNISSRAPMNFERANLDFKIRNQTGLVRCDVDEIGAPIPGVERGKTKGCPSESSRLPVVTATGTAAAKTTAANGQSVPTGETKPNNAAGMPREVGSMGLLMAVFAGLIFI